MSMPSANPVSVEDLLFQFRELLSQSKTEQNELEALRKQVEQSLAQRQQQLDDISLQLFLKLQPGLQSSLDKLPNGPAKVLHGSSGFVQDLFARFQHLVESFRGNSEQELRSYLWMILYNELTKSSKEEAKCKEGAALAEPREAAESPSRQVQAEEERQRTEAVLQDLPIEERLVCLTRLRGWHDSMAASLLRLTLHQVRQLAIQAQERVCGKDEDTLQALHDQSERLSSCEEVLCAELALEDRLAWEAREEFGWDSSFLAEILNCTENYVRVRAHRVRQRLPQKDADS